MFKHGFSVFVTACGIVFIGMVDTVNAQPGGFGGRGGRGRFGGQNEASALLMREDVRKELGVNEDQLKELREVAEEATGSIRDLFANMRNLSREERQEAFAGIQERREKMQAEIKEKSMNVLTSEQQSRFKELEMQFMLRAGNVTAALKSAGIEVSDEAKEKVESSREKIMSEMAAAIAEIQAEANRKMLAVVVSESQAEKLLGTPFAFQGAPGGGRPFGGGAFGAERGGQRGARGGRGTDAAPRRRGRPSLEDDSDGDAASEESPRRRRS